MFSRTSNCDHERLRRLLDGELSDAVATDVAVHIETCVACRDQMESFAANASWWVDTRDALSGLSSDQDSFLYADGDSQPDSRGGKSVPLDFLAPSDNPAMLGRLGEFEILEEIGCGGMGIVLKGYDHELNRYVAVKVLHPFCATSAAARRRFVREAQSAAAIVHQHVVAIHAVDANHHPPYLVMPFVPGESLQQRLSRKGPLDLLDGLRIGQQVAEGLAAAHAQGLVHRDIKPGNILLERNVERVLLTDFGLARAADDASLTRSGVIAGTPQYMSPEQARGEQVDHRTDLFSLGTVLYTIFAGHSPFRAESAMAVLRRVCDDTPRPLREVNPTVPEWLEAFIAKLHAKQPTDRFENAVKVASLLQGTIAHIQQPTLFPLPDEIARLVKPPIKPRSSRQFGLALVAVAVAAGVAMTVLALPRTNATTEKIVTTITQESPTRGKIEIENWDDGVQSETDGIRKQIDIWESDDEF
jgi:serine/threonine-protein kinase